MNIRHFNLSTLLVVALAAFMTNAFYVPPVRIFHSGEPNEVRKARVKLISADEADPVVGYLTLIETSEGVYVNGKIIGLKKGLHGFHVHQKGDLGNGCKNSGGHFNPFEKTHGDPDMPESRHVGDLGNIETTDFGEASYTQVNVIDDLITLEKGKDNDITGLAFVVHAGEDDLGRGGNEGSLKTGNAGGRVSCGIVEALNY